MPNTVYYKEGIFQEEIAKNEYFSMMEKFNYPIPQSLREGMWTCDFSLSDFANVGMAGIFWLNDQKYDYFAHEIFLLPGQMIVEHGHADCAGAKAKMESWHVRHGEIYTFSEGEETEELPCRLPKSQKEFITAKKCVTVKEGEVASLNLIGTKHFMIAGPEGAIVSEYGTYHDNEGLQFTNPTVQF